jgi:L-aspartate oxidase
VALSDEDEISLHEQDTIKAGDGLCRAEAVALLVEEGPKYIPNYRVGHGIRSRGNKTGIYARSSSQQIADPARTRRFHRPRNQPCTARSRAYHSRIYISARTRSPPIDRRIQASLGIRFIDETDGSHPRGERRRGTPGYWRTGRIYRDTTNSRGGHRRRQWPSLTKSGAVLSDMEFVQFHPTALAVKVRAAILAVRSVRGEGGVLRK